MGTINHNAVIATTWDEEEFKKVEKWIKNIPIYTDSQYPNDLKAKFTFCDSRMNGYQTIVMNPDGSKEGWPLSNKFDEVREEFIKQLDSSWDWISVSFGELGYKIEKSNDNQKA